MPKIIKTLSKETVKYINENSFIENLAASKYSMCAVLRELPCVQKCKQACVSKFLSAKKEK